MSGKDEKDRKWGKIDRAAEIFADLAPYISDHERALEAIKHALASDDPVSFIQVESSKAVGPFRTDLRLILNYLEKKRRT